MGRLSGRSGVSEAPDKEAPSKTSSWGAQRSIQGVKKGGHWHEITHPLQEPPTHPHQKSFEVRHIAVPLPPARSARINCSRHHPPRDRGGSRAGRTCTPDTAWHCMHGGEETMKMGMPFSLKGPWQQFLEELVLNGCAWFGSSQLHLLLGGRSLREEDRLPSGGLDPGLNTCPHQCCFFSADGKPNNKASRVPDSASKHGSLPASPGHWGHP